MENSVKLQIHQILCTTGNNGKKYHGRTYAKNEVVLETGWISEGFGFREPEFYNLVKMVTRDADSQNIYTVPVGGCNQQISVEKSKYEEKHKNSLIVPDESISKKEPIKIS